MTGGHAAIVAARLERSQERWRRPALRPLRARGTTSSLSRKATSSLSGTRACRLQIGDLKSPLLEAHRRSGVDSGMTNVRPIELSEIRAARERIAGTIVRTPLLRLELGPDFPDIRLKLENLQPINAYKLRGAA